MIERGGVFLDCSHQSECEVLAATNSTRTPVYVALQSLSHTATLATMMKILAPANPFSLSSSSKTEPCRPSSWPRAAAAPTAARSG